MESLPTTIAALGCAAFNWISANNSFVSAASAAIAASAAVVFGVYQVRIGRFTRQAALAAEAATKASIKLEQPILRIWDVDIKQTDAPVEPRGAYACGDILGAAAQHMIVTSFKISNFGRTPCNIGRYKAAYAVGARTPDAVDYRELSEPYFPKFLEQGGERTVNFDYPINLTAHELERIRAHGERFRIFILIEFTDFMDQAHYANGSWRWDVVFNDDDFDLVREERAPIAN